MIYNHIIEYNGESITNREINHTLSARLKRLATKCASRSRTARTRRTMSKSLMLYSSANTWESQGKTGSISGLCDQEKLMYVYIDTYT